MKKLNLLFSMMLTLCLAGYSQFRLETVPPLNGGNGSGGTAFQIVVKSPIILDSLRQAFQAGSSTPEIWYTGTDTVGPPNITVANGWTLVATSPALTGISAGLTPTLQTIPVGLGLVLTPGIYRFYIGSVASSNVIYTTWNAANQDVFDDTFITIRNGQNIGYGGSIPNPNFSPRQWNGGVVYSPLGGINDASVLSVDSPSVFCAGSYPVIARIGNYGLNQIDSVEINWEVNGVAQPVFMYRSLLDTLFGLSPNTAQVNLGTANFNAGNNTIRVFTSNPNGVADTTNLNDTIVRNVSSAAAPLDIITSNATLTSIDVTVVGYAGTLDYEYGITGFALGSGSTGNSSTASFTISGLTQGTTYDIYVRSNCGGNDISSFTGPETFNSSFGLPFAQDFENFANGIINNPFPEGWTASQPNGFPIPRWESELGQGFSPGFQTGPIWDHTNYGGPGVFMFMNSSGGVRDSVDFISPPIFVNPTVNEIEVGYWYFNFGADIERIEVIADTNGVETILATHTGQIQATQQDPWLFNSQRMSGVQGKSVTIKFRGYNSAGFGRGDLAIDDITVDPILPLNAGVVEIQSPSGALCPGSVTPILGVKNFGSSTIDSVNVIWDVNGVADSVTYVGTILPGDTASVALGTLTLSASLVYDIDFYTSLPNGMPDQFTSDDTLSIDRLRTGLAGIYTLDPSLPSSATNFASFAELEGSVNNFGMCGSATVNVAPGTYNGVVYFQNPLGLSASNSLTIDGGDSSLVTLTNNLANDDAIIRFDGASYINIKNMTVSSSRVGGGNHCVIHFGGESHHDSLVGVRVLVDPTATFGAYGILASSLPTNTFTAGYHANNIVIMNSSVNGGDNSIRLIGNGGNFPGNGAFPGWTVGNKVMNTTSTNADDIAFYFDDQDSIEVIGNTITGMRTISTFTGYGIEMFDGMNFIISGNYVVVNYTGIYVTNANSSRPADRPAEISNNMISADKNHGLWTTNSFSVNYWNNSVYCNSTDAFDAGIYLDDGFGSVVMDDLDFRNNVVYAPNVPAFRMDEPDTVFLKCDNNVYHTNGTNLLDIDGTLYTDLATYQTAQTAFNAASLSGNPQFASTTDLHIVGTFINDAGDNSVPVLIDIDGDMRPIAGSTTVDPGADEYNPPACPPVVNLRGTNLTFNTVDILWDGVSGDYDYEVVLAGNPVGSGTRVGTAIDSVRITGLIASTSYDVHVREICGRGDTSIALTYTLFTGYCTPAPSSTDGNGITNVTFSNVNNTGPIEPSFYGDYTSLVGIVQQTTTVPVDITYQTGFTYGTRIWIDWNRDLDFEDAGEEVYFGLSTNANPTTLNASFTVPATAALGIYTMRIGGSDNNNGPDPCYTGAWGSFEDYSIDVTSPPTCIVPTLNALAAIGPDTATISWVENNSATQWEIEYGVSGFNLGSGTSVLLNVDTFLTINSLNPNTEYDYYVRAVCTVGDTSTWANSQFETPCTSFTSPYYSGFENMTLDQNPDCWDDLVTFPNGNVWVRAFAGTAAPSAGSQALYIFPSSGYIASDILAAITPQFTDLPSGTKRIRFDANTDDVSVQLIVGTVDFPGTGGIYTPIDTLNFITPDVYANYLVEFTTANGYNGTDQYIYLAHSLPTVGTFDYIRIDEFRFEEIPSCVRPTNPIASNPTASTIDLAWTNGSTPATQWEIEYGLQGFTPGSGASVITTTNPTTLTGLTAGTIYEAYIRAICTPGDTSFRDVPALFFTDCSPITATNLPFIEDWETGGSGTVIGSGVVKCGPDFQWTFISNGPTGRARFGNTAFNTGGTLGAITLDMNPNGNVTRNELILTLDLSAQASNPNLSLTFDAMEHGEESNPGDSTWIRGSDTSAWVGILNNFTSITNTVNYDPFGPFDIDALLLAAGQTVSSTFQIRFGQEDNFPAPSDGFSFDNIAIFDAITGIDEIASNELYSVTPNPSNGIFTLNMKVDQREDFTMTVRDVKGQVVYTENLTVQGAYSNNLDFTSFAKGVYYMQIQTETEAKVEKLVIQ